MSGSEGVHGVSTADPGVESPDAGAPELNHVSVQQCSVVHGVPVKKHGGMIDGIDATPSAGEALPAVVAAAAAADNDVCLQ